MSTSLIDPQLLAAMLDGTATSEERAAVMQQIAGSRVAHAQFAEAAAIHRELSGQSPVTNERTPTLVLEQGGPGSAPRESSGPKRWWRLVVPLAMAAAVLLIMVVRRSPAPGRGAVFAVAETTRVAGASGSGSLDNALGPAWDEPTWSVTRGSGVARATTACAFRSGVRMAQLVAAINASDSTAAVAAVRRLRELLADVEGSAPIASQLEAITRDLSASNAASRSLMAEQLRSVLGATDWFELGLWTGASQLRALSGQEADFGADGAVMRALASLLDRTVEPAAAWKAATGPLRELAPTASADRATVAKLTSILAVVVAMAGG